MKKLPLLFILFIPFLAHAVTGYEGFTVYDSYDPNLVEKCYYGPFTECCDLLMQKYGYDATTLIKNSEYVLLCNYSTIGCAAGYYGTGWSSGNFYEYPDMGKTPVCTPCPESGYTFLYFGDRYITNCMKDIPGGSGSDSTGSYTYGETQCSWVP